MLFLLRVQIFSLRDIKRQDLCYSQKGYNCFSCSTFLILSQCYYGKVNAISKTFGTITIESELQLEE